VVLARAATTRDETEVVKCMVFFDWFRDWIVFAGVKIGDFE